MTASLPSEPALFGREGELISLSIATEPRLLEELLEALASLDFPVNPQLYHRAAEVRVEFPAYSQQIERVRDALQREGFDSGALAISRALGERNKTSAIGPETGLTVAAL
jgi:glutamine synthetase adenylyltransferase